MHSVSKQWRPRSDAADLGLHCLLMSHKRDARLTCCVWGPLVMDCVISESSYKRTVLQRNCRKFHGHFPIIPL